MVNIVYGKFKCKGCKDRKTGCHSTCNSYQEAMKQRKEVLDQEFRDKNVNYYFDRVRRKDKDLYD